VANASDRRDSQTRNHASEFVSSAADRFHLSSPDFVETIKSRLDASNDGEGNERATSPESRIWLMDKDATSKKAT
jgi:hypothetical protein